MNEKRSEAPNFEPEDGRGLADIQNAPTKPRSPIMPAARTKGPGLRLGSPLAIDTSGARERITLSPSGADVIGFAPMPPRFDVGGGAERPKWEALPAIADALAAHAARIEEEDRQDDVALATSIAAMVDGTFEVRHVDAPSVKVPYVFSDEAFGALVTRLDIPAAGRYLKACWPTLRAANVNGWIDQLRATEKRAEDAATSAGRASAYTPIDVRLRHRAPFRAMTSIGLAREVFALVSPAYGDFDADRLDEAIARVVDPAARARVTYDGRRTRWEITFPAIVESEHSNERFRAGVIVTTDDGGGGAIRGQAFVHGVDTRNVIHVPGKAATFEIRHVGDLEMLASKFRDGFGKATGAVRTFLDLWDHAVEGSAVDLVRKLGRVSNQDVPDVDDHAMAGIFRFLIEGDIIPVRGVKTEPAVVGLMRAWRETPSMSAAPATTRAAIVNAVATWAHTGVDADPWQEDEIQSAAGALLERAKKSNTSAIALSYLAPEDVKGR